MPKLTDLIEQLLKEMIEENNGVVEITRGELAQRVNCVPSQITYVLSTRFTNGQGYLVESRRGGGGWIRVRRVQNNRPSSTYLMHAIHSMGDAISQQDAQIFIRNFLEHGMISRETAMLLSAATCDQALARVPQPTKDRLRLEIFRTMMIQAIVFLEEEVDHEM